ncbi:uncharacterized protein [Dermacentor andersoni]|uniref:uncharacterized protein n=1 Tax=Dermacentor andersoni TaxID=34620 RepID=UPI0024174B53|nr:uncharacterized protein LOC129382443 isoform X1 [Dermacentor andersoni]
MQFSEKSMTHLLIPLFMGTLFPLTSLARGGPRKLQRGIPDAFEIFSRFPDVVEISNWNDDDFFECLKGKQVFFDPQAKKTTYIFTYKGHNGADKTDVAYHISQGPAINEIIYYLDDDVQHKDKGILHYTDYTTCNVIQGPYHGDQCMLFVSKESADNVTQDCIEQYNDICGAGFSMYARDLCPDDEE